MKKFLLSLILLVTLGQMNQAKAQCAGANVLVFNIVVVSPATGVYDWSYNWTFVQGNASILVVLKCGGTVVATSACNGDLRSQAGGQAGYIGSANGTLTLPDPSCPGVKELEVRVHSSSNCNGTYCAIPQNIILPVSFVSFDANRSRSNVTVSWATATEINNSGFAVERNVNGGWEQVAFVPSQATNGTSDTRLNYQYTDYNTVKGISQYRIRQVDLDGRAKYSEVRAVRGEGQSGKTVVYPNPSNDGKVNIVFEDANVTRNISISDMSGRTVKVMNGITTNTIQVNDLKPGMYSVRISVPATGDQSMEKIVVNKR